jgi:hypothetical protein
MVCSSSMNRMMRPSSGHFLEHGLQPLLELTAVLGTGQQARHVQHQHALVLQRLGHLAVDDALRQALDDGGLAHAGLADQHRVVLAAALQHLDGAADLVVAADHRVELAWRARSVRSSVYFFSASRWPSASAESTFWPPRTASMAASSALRVRPWPRTMPPMSLLAVGQRQQEHLAGDELVAALGGLLVGLLQQLHQVAPGLHLPATLHAGQVALMAVSMARCFSAAVLAPARSSSALGPSG